MRVNRIYIFKQVCRLRCDLKGNVINACRHYDEKYMPENIKRKKNTKTTCYILKIIKKKRTRGFYFHTKTVDTYAYNIYIIFFSSNLYRKFFIKTVSHFNSHPPIIIFKDGICIILKKYGSIYFKKKNKKIVTQHNFKKST